MKKFVSGTLIVTAGVVAGFVAITLYNLYPREIVVSEVEQEQAQEQEQEPSPYLAFLNEEEKRNLEESRTESAAAVDPVQKTEQADSGEPPEMSAELKSYIASAQPEKVMEFFAQARRERAEKIQAIMQDESVDQEWENQMKQYLSDAEIVLPPLKGITLITADCRETICALEVDYGKDVKNYKQIEPYMSNIGSIVGMDTWVHHDALPHGGVIYFARENTELPEMRKI